MALDKLSPDAERRNLSVSGPGSKDQLAPPHFQKGNQVAPAVPKRKYLHRRANLAEVILLSKYQILMYHLGFGPLYHY